MIKKIRKFYERLALSHLTHGISDSTARAIRMTSLFQVIMFILPTALLPSVLLVEAPETHFLSLVFYFILVIFMFISRVLLYLKYNTTSAVLTLLNVNLHLSALCISYPDDPAYLGFLLLSIIPFLMITSNYKKIRWLCVILPTILFLLHQYYYRVIAGSGIFGYPKWIVSADYLMPPLILLVLSLTIVVYQFVKAVEITEEKLSIEYAKSENLILNILPVEVANELKKNGVSKPRYYESATVCFTDFQVFTGIAESLTPTDLVEELDYCFSYFDGIMDKYNLEKLKTIGDSYMFAGGIPISNKTHAIDCVMAALKIQDFMNQIKEIKTEQNLPYWELRLGIHSGNLIAGVIGEKKFAYDVWSDTVNTASRCESSGIADKINISENTYELVKDFFQCEYRGLIHAKNKGEIAMYFIHGLLPELSLNNNLSNPNEEFYKLYNELKIRE